MSDFFFRSGAALLRTLIIGVLAYAALVLILRISGKRTLAKMNAFDLVVTVSLGSTLASILTSNSVALAQGVLALGLLILLQFLITFTAVRSAWVRRAIKSEPRLLVRDGEVLPRALKEERVTREEVLAAVRTQGLASIDQVAAVVLETDGSFSVIRSTDQGASALAGVVGADGV